MPTHYKKLFTIHRELLKRKIPDDIVPIFFDYLGENLDETGEDLINRHCFYEVKCKEKYKSYRQIKYHTYKFGHYCQVCDKIYKIRLPNQFLSHKNSSMHQKKLKLHNQTTNTEVTKKYLKNKIIKQDILWKYPKKQRLEMIDSVWFEYVEVNFPK